MPIDLLPPTEAIRQERTPFTLRGWHVLAAMIGFFAVVAVVNAVMMTIAITTMPGLDARNGVSRNGYDASQRYNTEIAAAAAQAERRISINVDVARTPDGTRIAADIARADAGPFRGALVKAALEHPASRQLDRNLTLRETRAGHYESLAPGLGAGAWTLVLRVEEPADAGAAPEARPLFVSRNRITVKD